MSGQKPSKWSSQRVLMRDLNLFASRPLVTLIQHVEESNRHCRDLSLFASKWAKIAAGVLPRFSISCGGGWHASCWLYGCIMVSFSCSNLCARSQVTLPNDTTCLWLRLCEVCHLCSRRANRCYFSKTATSSLSVSHFQQDIIVDTIHCFNPV